MGLPLQITSRVQKNQLSLSVAAAEGARRGTLTARRCKSAGLYGTEAEQWQDEPPDPSEIVYCAESFEAFMCRFWLENEIWYAAWKKTPMLDVAKEYIERYRGSGA